MLKRLLPSMGVRTLPKAAALRTNLLLSFFFALVFGVVYIAADLLGAGIENRHSVALPFESGIPFVPQMAVIYLSIVPLLMLSPFVLHTPRRLFPLVFVLSIEVLVAGVSFLLFPIEEMALNRAGSQPSLPFMVADALNLRYNYLPSLHVALSLTAVAVYTKYCDRSGRLIYWIWALLICASSALTHQHYVADVVAGAALAAAGMIAVFPWVSRPGVLDAVRIENICAREFMTFSRRHRRYLLIAVIIYWYSLLRWRKTRVLRVGFCLLQTVDDLLDGDRVGDADPSAIAADVVRQLESGQFRHDRLGVLAQSLAAELDKLRSDRDDPQANAVALIRHMMLDRQRARRRDIYDEQALRKHHRITFTHSLDLLLISVGARARAADVPQLIEAFGWCSTMRDLQEDLGHGLINIPADVVQAAAGEGTDPTCANDLLGAPAVRAWQCKELERAQQQLQSFGRKLPDPADAAGNRVLRLFHRSIAHFALRMERSMVRDA